MRKPIKQLIAFTNCTNLISLIDHGGRAGNVFISCTFEQHPEIICCPLVHYNYSYTLSRFGSKREIDSKEAFSFLVNESYFQYVYHSPEGNTKELISKIGGIPEAPLNRHYIQELMKSFFSSTSTISRKQMWAAAYGAYALARGIDLGRVKYIMINDAISSRNESVFQGYKGILVKEMLLDFPQAKLVNLVRDPRAQYASSNHQFVNELGNTYGLKLGNFWNRFKTILNDQITMEQGPANLLWILYQVQAARTAFHLNNMYSDKFMILRNEDINLSFLPTLKKFCQWLDVGLAPNWKAEGFVPTMLDVPWKGTGAYSNRYQTVLDGILKNDSVSVSLNSAGPNKYVTQRWKKRLYKWEITLLERLFKEEIEYLNYQILYDTKNDSDLKILLKCAWLPTSGELPNWRWLIAGFQKSIKEGINRLFYCVAFPVFYILVRIKLFRYVLRDKFFINVINNEFISDNMISKEKRKKLHFND